MFIDYLDCPICTPATGKKTGWYTTYSGKTSSEMKRATVYCESCGMLRIVTQKKGVWIFGKGTLE